MYSDLELTPKEEEEIIRKFAEKLHEYGMEIPAIFFLEVSKPIAYIWAEMGRFFIAPFLFPLLGKNLSIKGEKLFFVFKKRKNLENLINMLQDK